MSRLYKTIPRQKAEEIQVCPIQKAFQGLRTVMKMDEG